MQRNKQKNNSLTENKLLLVVVRVGYQKRMTPSLGLACYRDEATSKKLRICKKKKTFEMTRDNVLTGTEQLKLHPVLLNLNESMQLY